MSESYFLARVQPQPGALAYLDHVDLYPGMPAEVLIATGKRRAIDYFLSPLQDSMARADRRLRVHLNKRHESPIAFQVSGLDLAVFKPCFLSQLCRLASVV